MAVRTIRNLSDGLLAVLLLLVLLLPLADWLFALDSTPALDEKRVLAGFPGGRVDGAWLERFPETFEKWFNDRFGCRRAMVRLAAILKVQGLDVSTSPRVVLGREGWLYFTDAGMLEDHVGRAAVSPRELELWQRSLEGRRTYLAGRGIDYLFVVAPNKPTVYPEFLPERWRATGRPTRLERLVRHLREKSTFRILDLRGTFPPGGEPALWYYRTDTHWNQAGALAGYQAIMKALAGPGEILLSRERFRARPWRRSGDLAGMLGLNGVIVEEAVALEPLAPLASWETPPPFPRAAAPAEWNIWEEPRARIREGKGRRLLMFHDSFAYDLIPWLSEHFGFSVYLSMMPLDFQVFRTLVDLVRPDAVVEERAERSLIWTPRVHPADPGPAGG